MQIHLQIQISSSVISFTRLPVLTFVIQWCFSHTHTHTVLILRCWDAVFMSGHKIFLLLFPARPLSVGESTDLDLESRFLFSLLMSFQILSFCISPLGDLCAHCHSLSTSQCCWRTTRFDTSPKKGYDVTDLVSSSRTVCKCLLKTVSWGNCFTTWDTLRFRGFR